MKQDNIMNSEMNNKTKQNRTETTERTLNLKIIFPKMDINMLLCN